MKGNKRRERQNDEKLKKSSVRRPAGVKLMKARRLIARSPASVPCRLLKKEIMNF
jgi:hypothetical protein